MPATAQSTVLGVTTALVIIAGLTLAWRRPRVLLRARVAVLMSVLAVSALAAAALVDFSPLALHMSLDPSEEPMLAPQTAGRAAYRDAVLSFGDDDLYVIAMETDGVFTYDHLTTLRDIGNKIRRLPGVRSVESLVDTTQFLFINLVKAVAIGKYIDKIPTGLPELHRLRTRTLAHRLYPKTLVSKDGRVGAINVAFKTMSDGEFVEAGIDDSVAALLAEASTDGRRFYVTGRQHIKTLTHRLLVDDLLRLIPLAVAVGAAVAWIVTGSLRSAVISVGSSLIATLWAFGALAFLGRPLNLITVVLGPMLICVGSVYGVHVLAHFDRAVTEGHSSEQAALRCLRHVRAPVLIAGVTTCIGFSALLLSATPAIGELGTYATLGVASVTLIALTAVPCLLAVLPLGWGKARSGQPRALGRVVAWLLVRWSAACEQRIGVTLITWMLITAAAIAAIPHIVVDTDYLTFFNRDSRVRSDFDAISQRLVGAVPIYVVLDGGEEGVFRDPANLQALKSLQQRIEELPAVSTTLSIVDLIEPLNRVVEQDAPRAERIPDARGEVAELLFMLPKNKSRRYIDSNHSRTNIVVRTGISGSAAVLGLVDDIENAIAETDIADTISVSVTGNSVIVNRGAKAVASDQIQTVGAATFTILLLVALYFRSWSIGALAMIPNIVPVLVFFGILGAGLARLSLPTSLIGSIALGIAVDDTAHFLVGYRRRRVAGNEPPRAAAWCITELGQPIVTTSLMLMGGFMVLSLSNFATLREFGYLSALTMFACLCADLFLLPVLLMRARA